MATPFAWENPVSSRTWIRRYHAPFQLWLSVLERWSF